MWIQTVVIGRVESADASLATKGDKVWAATISVLEVPVLVAPHLASLTEASLRLINDEWDALSLR